MTETEPIDFFVYADQAKFYDALGPSTPENVAGEAFPNIRTLLGLIPPDQIDDPEVAVRIPHEFVHMVFDTASKQPVSQPAPLAQRGPGRVRDRRATARPIGARSMPPPSRERSSRSMA